ncbi:MAG: carbohydrate ABC transporter permease [SAR324 cluster bacterium]|nr:carbohydrate ABC transporter permease [SAR324 cluster bacterium]
MTGKTQTNLQTDQEYWNLRARKSKRARWRQQSILIGFLILASIPVLLPYFWLFTISFSARTGGVESFVLWRACAILLPAVFIGGAVQMFIPSRRHRLDAYFAIIVVALIALVWSIGPYLHLENYRFLWNPNIVEELKGMSGAGGDQFPWVWSAFWNSLIFACVQSIVVLYVSTLAGYYISRFSFPGRSTFLQSLLVLHAFPAMTLVIPIFLIMFWVGLIDTITGVVLVVVTLELPFSIFLMKGFFDSVSWDIEMSAIVDGASRRQAFVKVVLPQVKGGMLAIGILAFIKGWEEYVFVRTLLFEKSNWMMSLYLFWVSEDIMGVDYGIVAAVGVFYVLPSLLLYLFFQKYIVQLNIGGVKG